MISVLPHVESIIPHSPTPCIEREPIIYNEMNNHPVYKTWLALMEQEEKNGYTGLSTEEQNFWCVYLLDMEVDNGGFHQYFVNSSSDYAFNVLWALEQVGASNASRIARAAFAAIFPEGVVPADQNERYLQLEEFEETHPQFSKEFRDFDKQYYCDEDEIYIRLEAYARQHRFIVE